MDCFAIFADFYPITFVLWIFLVHKDAHTHTQSQCLLHSQIKLTKQIKQIKKLNEKKKSKELKKNQVNNNKNVSCKKLFTLACTSKCLSV